MSEFQIPVQNISELAVRRISCRVLWQGVSMVVYSLYEVRYSTAVLYLVLLTASNIDTTKKHRNKPV